MNDDYRALPHDIDAEQCALGAALISKDAAAQVATHLSADHFYRPHHRLVFRAVADLNRRGEPVDVVSVRAELERTTRADEPTDPMYLIQLSEVVPTAANVGFYIGRVRELGTKAIAMEELTRIVSRGYHSDTTADELLASVEDALATFRALSTDSSPVGGLSTMGSFVDEIDDEYDWLIPGVLERMDRVIVVASEGTGKSVLARQIAVMLAAGVHPFSWHTSIPPVRTLYVDLENPPPLIRRKARHLTLLGRKIDDWDDDRCWRFTRPGGIDLRKPHDQNELDRVIEEARPDLVVLGPLYKAFLESGEKAETVNGQVARVLDGYRERYGVALWLETHAPMEQNGSRSLRPMGSGVWSRWPEFGLALRKSSQNPNRVHVDRFRGDRDERAWPHYLERSSPWPWAPVWDGGLPVEEASGA